MPLYDWECIRCGHKAEAFTPPECNEILCMQCGGVAEKRFTKLTTSWKEKDRKWGTSLYRSHDKGKEVKVPKMPTFIPKELK